MLRTQTAVVPPEETSATAPSKPTRPVAVSSARLRILGWYVAILGVALVVGILLQRGILLARLNEDVNAALQQEVQELERLAAGNDPRTGRPFGSDVAAIFDTFLRRNIPEAGEALFTIIDGKPHASTVTPLQLLDDPAVVARWAAVSEPTRAELETAAGDVRYLAVPVHTADRVAGVFVVALFLQPKREQLDGVLQLSGAAYGTVLVIASALAWVAAGRVLQPVRLLTTTARGISDDNWSERIPVRGDDEIAELARTFNDMLDRLESAFATQRRFIDDAGHELRTPITIIRGHLELMGSDPEEREEVLRLVTDELDRMARMVDELLLLAIAEQPNFLRSHPLDVAELTEEILAKAVALAPDRQWRCVEAASVVLTGDRQRLTQAVMNLARNAVEHSAPGTAIEIGSRVVDGEVSISVRDHGEGISPSDHARIFERFARGRSRMRRSDGAGLGLSIVRTIVEAHGGRLGVVSAPGAGSTFTITIPLDDRGPDR